jgi:polyphosphate kinase 2
MRYLLKKNILKNLLIEDIEQIRSIMGLKEQENSDFTELNVNLKRTVDILEYLKIYSPQIERMLSAITKLSQSQVIDFGMLERGLRKVLLKKGEKKKNVEEYLGKIITSLKYRERSGYGSEPESEDYEFEIEEPSIVPKKVFKKELYELQVELLKLQEWLKETGKTVIIAFEGRDSAGKGSTIKKFIENLNPRYYNVVALGVPTPEDRKNWWDRYRKQVRSGMINLFDRSWYNRGLIEPVMGYGSPEEYEDFMENVEDFENDLVKEGDYLFKLWFSIDKDTQKRRFDIRQKSPLKYWKYSPNDSKMQDLWDRFTEFKEKLFDKTSTVNNPWVIIDAEDKRVSGLNAIRYVLQNIPYEGKNDKVLDREYPEALAVLRPQS